MMIIVSPRLDQDDQSSSVMVWSLFGITCLMAFIAFKKIVKRFIMSASFTEIVSTEPGPFGARMSSNPIAANAASARQSNLNDVPEESQAMNQV